MPTRSLALVALALALAGCQPEPAPTPVADQHDAGGSTLEDGSPGADAAELAATLLIDPPSQEAFVEELATFRAFLEDDTGAREDATGIVSWLLDGDLVGVFKAPGVVLVQAPGEATVIARLGGQEASADLTGLAPAANVSSLRVEPAALEVPVGLAVPVRAVAVYDDGQARDVTALAAWESLDPALVQIESSDAGALARGLAEGSGHVRASFAGFQAEASVEVVAAVLVAVELYPPHPFVPAGASVQVHAIGRYADGELFDLTDAVTWSSGAPSVFSVSDAGLVTGTAEGSATLTARAEADALEASVEVTVTPAQIVALDISPALIRVPAGSSVGLRATAVLTNEVVLDVTGQASWTVDDPEAAFFSGGAGAPWRLEAVYPTETVVRASYAGQSAQAPLIITAAELELVELYPPQWSLPAGEAQQFWFIGTFGDGTRADLSADATWTSSDPAVALVTAPPPGQVIAVAPGRADISAAYRGFAAGAVVQVTDAEVVSIQIHPPLVTIPAGEDIRFVCIGIYSDGTQRDLTAETTWSVDATAVASISNAFGEWGLAVGVAPGTTTVTAQYGDLSDTATLRITDAVVTDILVTPFVVTLTPGRGEQCQAWASYSNGTTLEVGQQAVWTSSDGAVAEVSNAAGQAGWLTAMAPGEAQVTARFGGVAGVATVYVLAQPISGIVIWPEQIVLAPDLTEQLYLIGWYDDLPNEYENLTWEAVWSTSDQAIATIGNYPTTPGLLAGHSPGRVTVTARWGEQVAQRSYSVQDLRVIGLTISPPDPVLPIDALQAFVALATLEDHTTRDVTADAVFSSDDSAVVSVFEYWAGWAWALAPGQAHITARLGEESATTTVTVIDAAPQQIVLSPINPILELYQAVQFYATAVYEDGSSGDVTYLCSWASSNPRVVLVVDEPGGKGYALGFGAGAATVSADCNGLESATVATVR